MVPEGDSVRIMAIVAAHTAGAAPGDGPEAQVAALGAYARALATAGVDVVQLRDPGMSAALLARSTRAMAEAIEGTATRLVVNDRADVAMVGRAAGVHLRAVSMPARRVRPVLGPRALIGRSTHVHDDADPLDVEGVDYVVFGTVFPSGSKPAGHPVAGLDALEAQCRATPRPVLAVGGITVQRCADVAARGAAGVAAIGVFADAWRRGGTALQDVVAEMRALLNGPEAGR